MKTKMNLLLSLMLISAFVLAACGGTAAATEPAVAETEPPVAVTEPPLVRPPGHHASAEHAWGFCFLNNMASALDHLNRAGKIHTAHVLDFDLHYGVGTVNILKPRGYVTIHNPQGSDRKHYLDDVSGNLAATKVDMIAVSAGFDNHREDWGGLLLTEDYYAMGQMVREASKRQGCGCFAVLEGGYNHRVLGEAVRAFLRGLEGKESA